MSGHRKHSPIVTDAHGRIVVDSKAASDIWGDGAERVSTLAFSMYLIEKGWLDCVWDTLAQTNERADVNISLGGAPGPSTAAISAIAQLTKADRLAITRAALSKLAELRPQDAAMAEVVLAQLPQQKRLKAANRIDPALRAAVREKCRANPKIGLGQLGKAFPTVSRASLHKIQSEVRTELGVS